MDRVWITPSSDVEGSLSIIPQLKLPDGAIVRSEQGTDVGWLSRGPVDTHLWQWLLDIYPRSGLWPVWASGLSGDIQRPWLSQELDGVRGEPGDPAPVLGTLAPPLTDLPPELEVIQHTAHLLLVPARRPADVPWHLGWLGPANYDLTGDQLTAVLRSWEDRFGAYLVALGFDTMGVEVTRSLEMCPMDQLMAIGAEHVAFDPDLLGEAELEDYADVWLPTARRWEFWWD